MSLLGASLTLVPNSMNQQPIDLQDAKPLLVNNCLEKSPSTSQTELTNRNIPTKDSKKTLNQTKVYLITAKNFNQKHSNNILLSLQTEDRLYSEPSLVNFRHTRFFFKSFYKVKSKGTKEIKIKKRPKLKDNRKKTDLFRFLAKRRKYFGRSLRPTRHRKISRSFRSGKTYYIENKGGYKSICPVFFDLKTAEEFLITRPENKFFLVTSQNDTTTNKRSILNLFTNKNQELTNNQELEKENTIEKIEIMQIGLGDFIEYYSLPSQKETLKKTEFLFFPDLEEIKFISQWEKIKFKIVVGEPMPKEAGKDLNLTNYQILKGFTNYQKDFYKMET